MLAIVVELRLTLFSLVTLRGTSNDTVFQMVWDLKTTTGTTLSTNKFLCRYDLYSLLEFFSVEREKICKATVQILCVGLFN